MQENEKRWNDQGQGRDGRGGNGWRRGSAEGREETERGKGKSGAGEQSGAGTEEKGGAADGKSVGGVGEGNE